MVGASTSASTAEVRIRITMATTAIARLSRLCTRSSISFPNKSLVVSILLYDCVTWTLYAETWSRVHTFKNNYLRRLTCISFILNKSTEFLRNLSAARVGPQELPTSWETVKRRKLVWCGHVTRRNSLYKNVLKCTLSVVHERGRQKKSLMEDLCVVVSHTPREDQASDDFLKLILYFRY